MCDFEISLISSLATYAQAVLEIGKLLNLPVLNLWQAMVRHIQFTDISLQHIITTRDHTYIPGAKSTNTDRRLQSYLRDGLHLSRDGYALVHTELMILFDLEFPNQLPEKLPFVFPAWDDEEAWGSEDVKPQI